MSKELADRLEYIRDQCVISYDASAEGFAGFNFKQAIDEAIAALRAEPVAGQLSAETIEEWREWWHNMPYKDGEIAQVNQICDAALSSLRGTFADGIEAAAKLADSNGGFQIRWFASEIRALAQGQRTSEQDADKLLRECATLIRHQQINCMVYEVGIPKPADILRRIDAHLSRKEPK